MKKKIWVLRRSGRNRLAPLRLSLSYRTTTTPLMRTAIAFSGALTSMAIVRFTSSAGITRLVGAESAMVSARIVSMIRAARIADAIFSRNTTIGIVAMVNDDNDCGLGLNVDMLDVDRLRDWARLIDVHGDHISDWGDPIFVSVKLRDIADRLADEVRDVLKLRAALAAHSIQCPQCHEVALASTLGSGTASLSEAGSPNAQEQRAKI